MSGDFAAMLRDARYEAGTPTLRELGEAIGYSFTHIGDVLNGNSIGGAALVAALANHLCEPADAQAIIEAHRAAVTASSKPQAVVLGPAGVDRIVEAIDRAAERISAAIREARRD